MSKTILSVDDSRMVHMVVAKTLKPYDVELLTASNGEEGVKLALDKMPDLVLLDATMPIMNGIEALEELKNTPETKEIPVVMLSADCSQDNMDQAMKIGALKFISKPFTAEKLLKGLAPFIELTARA